MVGSPDYSETSIPEDPSTFFNFYYSERLCLGDLKMWVKHACPGIGSIFITNLQASQLLERTDCEPSIAEAVQNNPAFCDPMIIGRDCYVTFVDRIPKRNDCCTTRGAYLRAVAEIVSIDAMFDTLDEKKLASYLVRSMRRAWKERKRQCSASPPNEPRPSARIENLIQDEFWALFPSCPNPTRARRRTEIRRGS
ncbi:hypothetical protein [Rhizobium sp. NLR22b]|uniref:hypothetical protein n=1 Tax=Rhizobium sp. NLR22b TaxID=2731115 RepID=UPI001C8323B4|nr:hypothetical protein [Rhizobium sp. NLR22b]MBX5242049.1 hypothetical protein [Rhizobium sp. NLR22b]